MDSIAKANVGTMGAGNKRSTTNTETVLEASALKPGVQSQAYVSQGLCSRNSKEED